MPVPTAAGSSHILAQQVIVEQQPQEQIHPELTCLSTQDYPTKHHTLPQTTTNNSNNSNNSNNNTNLDSKANIIPGLSTPAHTIDIIMNTAERHHQLNHHHTKDLSTPSKKRKASLTSPDRSRNSGFSSDHSDSTISDTSITTITTPTSKRLRKSAATDPLSPLANVDHSSTTAVTEPTSTRTTTTTSPDCPSPHSNSKPKRRSSAHKPKSSPIVGMGTIDFNLDDNKMNVDGTSPSSSPGSLSSSSSLSTATTGSTVILPSTPTPAATPLKTASPLPPSEHKPSSSSSAPPRPPARPRATSHATHLAHETPRRPSRRNKRDSVAPQDSTLLGLSQDTPLVPAGGYIIYVTNTLDKTTFDKDRVPPSTYGAIAPPTSSSPSLPPLKHFVHIEVPIFKPCSIAQFQQDEKKRKMEILSKALAKEEARAAAEALALAASHEPVAPPAPGARTVSTRLKHKEAASHQQVSVVTATPGAHGKKSTTVVTTGTGSGTAAGSHHKRLDEEDLHDEVYEKRHRKQEMLERRIKNREKEKLRHAMYQQQQVVEKLRHMDINRLMPLSAFRTQTHKKTTLEEPSSSSVSVSQSQDDGHGAGSSQISVAAAKIMQEEYHRRLIREAEESLSRFEQLGLSGETSTSLTDYSPFSRTKNRLLSLEIEPVSSSEPEESESEDEDEDEDEDQETAKHYLSDEPTPKVVQRKRTRVVSGEEEGGRRRARKSTPSTTISSTPSSRKPKAASTPVEPPRPPKPITTFIKPGSILASGGRKSSRVALAFGEKVPMLDRMDFDLPMDDVFGPLLRARLSARGETVPGTDKDKDKGKGKVTKGRIHVQATVSTSISAKENKDIDPEESSISSTLSSEISLSSDASSLVE